MIRAGVILVALATLVAVFIATVRQPSNRVVLTNGDHVELLCVGPANQTLTTEKAWHRWSRRLLPKNLQGWIPASSTSFPFGPSNALAVLVKFTDSKGRDLRALGWRRFRTEADDGFVYPFSTSNLHLPMGSATPSSTELILYSFPRRQRAFRLHFVDYSGGSMGFLTVPNPFPRTLGEWTPEELPIRLSNGPVTLTLEDLFFVDHGAGSSSLEAKWDRKFDDQRWEQIGKIERVVEDATGNSDLIDGAADWSRGQSLSPSEAAWKVTARMRRVQRTDFAPDERLVLTNLTLPPRHGFVAIDEPATNIGCGRLVGVVGGMGTVELKDVLNRLPQLRPFVNSEYFAQVAGSTREGKWTSTVPFLRLDLDGVTLRDIVWVRALDSNGRYTTIQNKLPIVTGVEPHTSYIFEGDLPLEKDTTLQALEITVSRPLEFEFFVDPKAIRQDTGSR